MKNKFEYQIEIYENAIYVNGVQAAGYHDNDEMFGDASCSGAFDDEADKEYTVSITAGFDNGELLHLIKTPNYKNQRKATTTEILMAAGDNQ